MNAANFRCYLFLLSIFVLSITPNFPAHAQEGEGADTIASASDAAAMAARSAKQQTLLEQGKQYLKSGQFDLAVAVSREVLSTDSENKEAKKLLGQAEKKLGIKSDTQEVAEDLKAKAKVEAKLAEESKRQAEEAVRQKAEEEKKLAEQQNNEKSVRVTGLMKQASEAADNNDFSKAIASYEEAIQVDPENSKLLKAVQQVRERQARAQTEQAGAEKQKQQEESERKLAEEKATAQTKIDALLNQATEAAKNGDFKGSITAYEETLRLDSGNAKATKGLEKIKAEEIKNEQKRLQAEEDQKAEEEKRRLAQERQQNEEKVRQKAAQIDSLLAQASDQAKQDDYAAAIDTCRKALEIDQNNSRASKELKRLLAKSADAEEEARVALAKQVAKEKEDLAAATAQKAIAVSEKAVIANNQNMDKESAVKKLAEDAAAAAKLAAASEASIRQPVAQVITEPQVQVMEQPLTLPTIPEEVESSAPQFSEPAPVIEVPASSMVAPAPPSEPAAEVAEPISSPETIPSPAVEVISGSDTAAEADAVPPPMVVDVVSSEPAPGGPPATAEPVTTVTLSRVSVGKEATPLSADDRRKIDKMLEDAMLLYKNDRASVDQARVIWTDILEMDPMNKQARTMIEETEAEYQRLMADRTNQKAATQVEAEGREKLNTAVTVTTSFPTPLVDFLQILSFASGINFTVAEGSEAVINASYVDKPLREILDAELLPKGLKWSRTKGDIIIVEPDLKTKVFHLNKDQMAKVQTLMADNTLQRILYGPTGEKPLKKTFLQMDEREGVLIAVDSVENLEKLDKFLADLRRDQPIALETRIYTIPEEQGPQIKALIDALIKSDKTPYDLERNVFIAGKSLIVKDTPEHLKRIEEMLTEKEFIRSLHDGRLEIATFSLIPREAIKDPDMAADFASKIVEVVRTLLYAEDGESKAAEEGRRLWFDPVTLQLDIIDFPDRIQAVANYIAALPSIRQREYEKVIALKHLESGEMETRLNEVLELTGVIGVEGEGATGTEITRSLRTEQEFVWRDLAIRLRRVNENDTADDVDDSAELIIRTSSQSQTITLTEFESTFVEDYEIIADDVRPSGGEGEGRMTITIRLAPQGGFAQPLGIDPVTGLPVDAFLPPPVEDEDTLRIASFPSQNSLIIRYQNPADLEKVEKLIVQLDKPIPQVNIETRFVTVNEQRAKEFSSEWSFLDLSDPRMEGTELIPDSALGPKLGGLESITDSVANGGFGNDSSELQSIFEPFTEQPAFASNLMKGTTIVNSVLGDILGNQVNWELRLLEAEGIINVVNGPHVVVMDGESANFEIHQSLPTVAYNITVPSSITGIGQTTFSEAIPSADPAESDRVLMDVSPQVTSVNSILLDIDVEIMDYEGTKAGTTSWNLQEADGLFFPQTRQRDFKQRTGFGVSPFLVTNRKILQTRARIKDQGTIVLGGWTGEFSQDLTSGVPVLRNLPYVGKLLFSRNKYTTYKTTLLIFLSGNIVD